MSQIEQLNNLLKIEKEEKKHIQMKNDMLNEKVIEMQEKLIEIFDKKLMTPVMSPYPMHPPFSPITQQFHGDGNPNYSPIHEPLLSEEEE